jgi:hypothetical protein
VFTGTTFTIVFIHDESPWLIPSLETLRNLGNSARRVRILVKGYVHVSTFVVDCLWAVSAQLEGKMMVAYSNEEVLGNVRQMALVLQPGTL